MIADDPIARYWRLLADNNWSKVITHDNDPCDDATGWFKIEWVPVMDARVRPVHDFSDNIFACNPWPDWELVEAENRRIMNHRFRCILVDRIDHRPKGYKFGREPIATADTFECQLCGRIWPTGHSCENCHPERNL